MSNFHKPKVYRSSEGCCICRAKSSSSRFTDCNKYENFLVKCFDLKRPRHGEICNACVLLVKRYKQLPEGSTRHWGHVVDARAGPGVKHKKHRDDVAADDQPSTSAAAASSTAASNSHSRSLASEKFRKILKKNKKSKAATPAVNGNGNCNGNGATSAPANGFSREGATKRKAALAANAAWESAAQAPGTPDSLDSDYEYNSSSSRHLASSSTATTNGSSSSTIVQFQTQTRASSYRSRNGTATTSAAAVVSNGVGRAAQRTSRPLLKVGSRRRQILSPRKNRGNPKSLQETTPFYDASDGEWQPQNSCCGPTHVCNMLGGALLYDEATYKRCAKHGGETNGKEQTNISSALPPSPRALPNKTNIATLPAIVQLGPPTPAVVVLPTKGGGIAMSTPVVKKHHLFSKWQSECFPQGDLVSATTSNSAHNLTKTEHSSTTKLTRTTPLINLCGKLVSTISSSLLSSVAGTTTSSHQLQPRHSAAKITTITPMAFPHTPLLMHQQSNITSNTSASVVGGGPLQNKSTHNFIHKIKADSGKIVKHSSLNSNIKLNTSAKIGGMMRVRPADLLIDPTIKLENNKKSYVMAPATTARQQPKTTLMAQPAQSAACLQTTQSMQYLLQLSGIGSSSAASQSPSGSTKFNDNSSDSGFDENMLDRKSVSPPRDNGQRPENMPSDNITFHMSRGVTLKGNRKLVMGVAVEMCDEIEAKRKKQGLEECSPPTKAMIKAVREHCGAERVPRKELYKLIPGARPLQLHRRYADTHKIVHENGITTIVPITAASASANTSVANNTLWAPRKVSIEPASTTTTATAGATLAKLNQESILQFGCYSSKGNQSNSTINDSNISSLNQSTIVVNISRNSSISGATLTTAQRPAIYDSANNVDVDIDMDAPSTSAAALNKLKKGL